MYYMISLKCEKNLKDICNNLWDLMLLQFVWFIFSQFISDQYLQFFFNNWLFYLVHLSAQQRLQNSCCYAQFDHPLCQHW